MADHEDYLPGETPAAHKVTHQNGGVDELSVAGLSGTTEKLAAHILLPTVHQDAPALILTHKGDAAAHHAKYTDGEAEAVADAQILTHKGDATAHQDAPALIEGHRLAAAAHHAKYTNAEAVTAMGALGDGNPLNHDKAEEWGATEHTAIGDAAPHHAKYTDANARASINGIFGSDGKADSDVDLDGHALKSPNIVFPATQVPSADVNTLDDYQEGTWTPDLQFGGAKVGITYNATYHHGLYTKIGRLLSFSCYMVLTSKGLSTGIAEIHGLPFSTATGVAASVKVHFLINYGISFLVLPMARIFQNSSVIYLEESSLIGDGSSLTNANFKDNSQFGISGIITTA